MSQLLNMTISSNFTGLCLKIVKKKSHIKIHKNSYIGPFESGLEMPVHLTQRSIQQDFFLGICLNLFERITVAKVYFVNVCTY